MSVDLVASLTGLAQNIALLLALTMLYGVLRPWLAHRPPWLHAPLAGVLFGLIAIAGMHTPIVVAPGVIADARMIPVLLAGPFGGTGAAIIAGVLASVYRFVLGGAGAWAGIGTILSAAALGVAVTAARGHRDRPLTAWTFVLLGVALDAIVLLWAVALPGEALVRQVLNAAAIPVGLFLPVGTLVLGMLLVNADRSHAERERLTLMQVSLERAAEAVFWVDASGRLVNGNPAAVAMTGRGPDELREMRLWDLDVSVTRESWSRVWATARTAGRLSSESRYRRSDGDEIPVETSTDFVEYRGQRWLSVFVHDVTERKRLEDERAEHLAREQLLRVKAEEASVLKDQFLATLSHELRTPLTAILGYTSLLSAGSLKGVAFARALEVIERNARAQAKIVDDLLDVSRIVLRNFSIEGQPIDLAQLVDGEVQDVREDAERRQLRLAYVTDGGRPLVWGEAARIHQIVENLLSNALKFSDPGGAISVRVEASEAQARVVVQDTGQGIDPEFLPHVFDRFRQAETTMTRSHGGLGVGLAIVHHLVELHGGTVAAASDGRGKGSTFIVTLPRLAAARRALAS